MSDLEKREIQFSAVQDRGEALVLQHHPAAKTIEAYMSQLDKECNMNYSMSKVSTTSVSISDL